MSLYNYIIKATNYNICSANRTNRVNFNPYLSTTTTYYMIAFCNNKPTIIIIK